MFPQPLSLDDLAASARAFVQGDVALIGAGLTAQELWALVQYLVDVADVPRLTRLAESPERRAAKEARRGLHLLRSRGSTVTIPVPGARSRPKTESEPGAAEEQEIPSLVTIIDGRGDRVVWLAMRKGSRVAVYQAAISETRGLAAFHAEEITRKEWRGHVEQMMSYPHVAVARTSGDEARRILDGAYDTTIAAGRAVPREFSQVRLELPRGPIPPRHPALDLVEPASGSAPELDRGLEALADRIELSTWMADPAALTGANCAVGPDERRLIGLRLYETALVFHARGDVQGARLCRLAGDRATDPSVSEATHPFLRRMVLGHGPQTDELQSDNLIK